MLFVHFALKLTILSVPEIMDAPEENFTENEVMEPTENSHNQKQGRDEDITVGSGEKKWPGWPGESVFRILIPSHKVGGIIGRKGESIRKMCEESRARIKILDAPSGIPERAVSCLIEIGILTGQLFCSYFFTESSGLWVDVVKEDPHCFISEVLILTF